MRLVVPFSKKIHVSPSIDLASRPCTTAVLWVDRLVGADKFSEQFVVLSMSLEIVLDNISAQNRSTKFVNVKRGENFITFNGSFHLCQLKSDT